MNPKNKEIILSLFLLIFCQIGWAQADKPSATPFDQERVLPPLAAAGVGAAQGWISDVQYPYQAGEKTMYLYGAGQAQLVCAPFRLCLVELERGERVQPQGIQLGDTARWQATPAVGAGGVTTVVLKPAQVGLETNLVLVTDKRIYHVNLISRETDYMPAIAWAYPDEADQQWQDYWKQGGAVASANGSVAGVGLAGLDFNYSITGCDKCGWKPLRVYTDSKQTVIEVPDIAEMPALMVINGAGDENLVNYRINGNRFIVDQVFSEAVLVVGVGEKQQRVTIRKGG